MLILCTHAFFLQLHFIPFPKRLIEKFKIGACAILFSLTGEDYDGKTYQAN